MAEQVCLRLLCKNCVEILTAIWRVGLGNLAVCSLSLKRARVMLTFIHLDQWAMRLIVLGFLFLATPCVGEAGLPVQGLSSAGNQVFTFEVGDENCITVEDIVFLEQYLDQRGFSTGWGKVPESDCYMYCPFASASWPYFRPCRAYDRPLFSACVASSGASQPNNFIVEDCYHKAVDPSLFDRLRFR